jgi:3-hydroxybutyryl-CoA dehydratase
MTIPDVLVPVRLGIDRGKIKRYADLTDDHNPIHVDEDFASRSFMGGLIAHGTMSMNLIMISLARSLGAEVMERMTLDVRFLKPVRPGDEVEAGGRRREEPGLSFDVWVENGRGERVIVGTATLRDTPDT